MKITVRGQGGAQLYVKVKDGMEDTEPWTAFHAAQRAPVAAAVAVSLGYSPKVVGMSGYNEFTFVK